MSAQRVPYLPAWVLLERYEWTPDQFARRLVLCDVDVDGPAAKAMLDGKGTLPLDAIAEAFGATPGEAVLLRGVPYLPARLLFERNGWTHEELAGMTREHGAGVQTKGTIHNFFTGKRPPGRRSLRALALALGADPLDIELVEIPATVKELAHAGDAA